MHYIEQVRTSEPANLGTKGQHATSRPYRIIIYHIIYRILSYIIYHILYIISCLVITGYQRKTSRNYLLRGFRCPKRWYRGLSFAWILRCLSPSFSSTPLKMKAISTQESIYFISHRYVCKTKLLRIEFRSEICSYLHSNHSLNLILHPSLKQWMYLQLRPLDGTVANTELPSVCIRGIYWNILIHGNTWTHIHDRRSSNCISYWCFLLTGRFFSPVYKFSCFLTTDSHYTSRFRSVAERHLSIIFFYM
jgi:hypothetical protein